MLYTLIALLLFKCMFIVCIIYNIYFIIIIYFLKYDWSYKFGHIWLNLFLLSSYKSSKSYMSSSLFINDL